MNLMCPYCGDLCGADEVTGLTRWHKEFTDTGRGVLCVGSGQVPRCAQSDARPLWNGMPNRHFERAK